MSLRCPLIPGQLRWHSCCTARGATDPVYVCRPPPTAQYCGSCWAFATSSCVADRIKIRRGAAWPEVTLAPQVLVNCRGGGSCEVSDRRARARARHEATGRQMRSNRCCFSRFPLRRMPWYLTAPGVLFACRCGHGHACKGLSLDTLFLFLFLFLVSNAPPLVHPGPAALQGGNPYAAYEYMAASGLPDETCNIYEAVDGECRPFGVCETCTPPGPGQTPTSTCAPITNFTSWTVSEYGYVSSFFGEEKAAAGSATAAAGAGRSGRDPSSPSLAYGASAAAAPRDVDGALLQTSDLIKAEIFLRVSDDLYIHSTSSPYVSIQQLNHRRLSPRPGPWQHTYLFQM